MFRFPASILLAVAALDSTEASAMIFPPIPQAPVTTQAPAGVPNMLPPSAIQGTKNAMPLMIGTPHVPVYSTFALPPPKPPKQSPIFVPDSQNLSRRRHLGW